jgi:glutaconate CoA-transferase subunit A
MEKKTMKKDKRCNVAEAVSLIQNGDTVAIGGSLIRRHPMALIFEMIRQGKKDLTLLGWNNAIDMDLLIGAGCVKTIETSYVGMAMLGLAFNFRREVESGHLRVYEHSETTAIDAFRAASMGWTFFPTKTPLGSGIEKYNENIRHMDCPYTGEKYCLLPAFTPDVAVIHAHVADYLGNVQLDPKRELDNEVDTLIAKSAKKVIVTVEQIVSEDYVYRNPHLTILPKFFVDKVVETPFGAHPTACDCRYDYDLDFLRYYHDMSKQTETFRKWLDKYVYGVSDHFEYLDLIGIKNLLAIKRPKEVR